MGLVFHRMTGPDAKVVLDDAYVDIYLAIRAEPPYNSGPLYSRERFVERTAAQVGRPGFELVAAELDGRPVGFAFGMTMEPGRWWGGEATPPPDEVLAAEKLAVVELDVLPQHRRQGVGKRLLATLLYRAEPWATLLSRPDTPAHGMYERWGWQVVGTVRPAPDAVVADAMVLHLDGGGPPVEG